MIRFLIEILPPVSNRIDTSCLSLLEKGLQGKSFCNLWKPGL